LQFTNRNARFIFSQMEPANALATLPIMNCFSALCDPNVLTINGAGSGLQCFGGTGDIFSVKALPTPSVVTWSASNNLVTLNFQTAPNQVLISPSSATAQGWVTIRAVVNAAECNNFTRTLTRRIWVGEPNPIRFTSRVEGCYFVVTAHSAGAINFSWAVNNPNIALSTYGGNNAVAIHAADWISLNLTELDITCEASNACNSSTPLTKTQTFYRPTFPSCPFRVGQPAVKAYPNPASSQFTLSFAATNKVPVSLSLRNLLGVTVLVVDKPVLSADQTLQVAVQTLPEGLYVLQIQYADGSTDTQKIAVQKGEIKN
jgi:hypothetical protein